MAQKQKAEEFGSVSEADEAERANIHGKLAAVSPMKKGRRAEYFEAKIADGAKKWE